MGQFCSESPKPHIIYSNDEIITQRISERAGYMSREDQSRLPTRTSKTYKDRFGVKRCVGLKKEMRESQHYPPAFGKFIAELFLSREGAPLPGPRCSTWTFDETLTDLQLFRKHCLPLGDMWPEADLLSVAQYLGRCKHMTIPVGWDSVLQELRLRPVTDHPM